MIFRLDSLGISLWVTNIYTATTKIPKTFHNINDPCIADIGTVFLESEPQNQNLAPLHLNSFSNHELDNPSRHIFSHSVIHATAGQNDFRIIPIPLGTLGQVIRIHPNAVSANKPRFEG